MRTLTLAAILLSFQEGEELTVRFKYAEGEKERYSVDVREKVAMTVTLGRVEEKRSWTGSWSAILKVKCNTVENDTFKLAVGLGDFEFKRETELPGDKVSLHVKEGTVRLKSDRHGPIIDTDKRLGEEHAKRILGRLKYFDTKDAVTMTPLGVITPRIRETFEGTVGDTLFPIALPSDPVCAGDEWERKMECNDFSLLYFPKPYAFKAKYKIEKLEGKGMKREAVISLTFDVTIEDSEAEVDVALADPMKVQVRKLTMHASTWNRIGIETGKLHASSLSASVSADFSATDPETKRMLTFKGESTVSGTILPER